MLRLHKSTTPSRREKQTSIFNNLKEAKMPEYDSYLDPHLSNYFSSKQKKNISKVRFADPIYKIYNSNKSLSPLKLSIRHKSPQLPRITKRLAPQNIKPVTAEQFKQILQKFRDKSLGTKCTPSVISDRVFITS
ncbi:hypothetical protein SteCoe_5 [Stentor coeruleus]|uniref:Uncharacterized protein n=1 Tax=Stentor coeruleus TaxID=5963 RepID=A0A1R2D4Z6_9CILI|nr:hypothetical protein SteCoe_5 [Stentor coeruleus]